MVDELIRLGHSSPSTPFLKKGAVFEMGVSVADLIRLIAKLAQYKKREAPI